VFDYRQVMFVDRLYWTLFLARHIRGQARYPFKPKAVILRDQSRNIRRMMSHAYRRVPYYRETLDRLGLRPSDFRTAADLARLPILERHDIQKDPERFIAAGSQLDKCLCLVSSGSSGAPIKFFHGKKAALLTAAHNERYRSVIAGFAGKKRGYRETIIMIPVSSSVKHRRFWLGSTLFMKNFIPRKQILSVFDPPEKNIPLITSYRPDVVLSFGSYLEALFARMESWTDPYALPKVAAYGADGLSEQARRLIQDRFGVEVASSYAAVEVQRIGFECERHSGIHINEDIYPLRIVDAEGRTLPAGENGEVVVSNLVNRTMVVLNYRLGDTAALLPAACPCGRSLALMSFPLGRRGEWLRRPDGGVVHGQIINHLLREEESVYQFQVVQSAPERFGVSLVARENANRADLEARIISKFKTAFGESTRIDVYFVSSIPREASGKIRPIVPLVLRGEADAEN
jgi:phenylacetate-CoA ligase